jgi:hypothetical protein
MAPSFNSGWPKVQKYYQKTENTPIYAAALVLHLAYKWEYVEGNWDAAWVPETKKHVEEFWRSHYSPPESVTREDLNVSRNTVPNQFSIWRKEKQATK